MSFKVVELLRGGATCPKYEGIFDLQIQWPCSSVVKCWSGWLSLVTLIRGPNKLPVYSYKGESKKSEGSNGLHFTLDEVIMSLV